MAKCFHCPAEEVHLKSLDIGFILHVVASFIQMFRTSAKITGYFRRQKKKKKARLSLTHCLSLLLVLEKIYRIIPLE
jgi:transposase